MDRLDGMVEKARERARFRIAALRLEYPGQDEVALGRRLVRSMALRAGLAAVGAGAGQGGSAGGHVSSKVTSGSSPHAGPGNVCVAAIVTAGVSPRAGVQRA